MPESLWRITPLEPLEQSLDEQVHFWNEWADKAGLSAFFYLNDGQAIVRITATLAETSRIIGQIITYCPDIGSIARKAA